uniref:Uncharacterized protein n=1 Tax=Strigamia maritima TaxID=126957 RepID=T1IMD9_STRMM
MVTPCLHTRESLKPYIGHEQRCKKLCPLMSTLSTIQTNQSKATAGEYMPHNISSPWETVCVDLMGPKPVGINQYKWLL